MGRNVENEGVLAVFGTFFYVSESGFCEVHERFFC